MSDLEITLLGSFQVRLAGDLVPQFATAKVQALLAYLAMEAQHPHRREALAGLLWPEQPESAARLSLRQTLYQLRQVIPPVYLTSTRQTVQFNPDSDYSLDTADFSTLINMCRSHPHSDLVMCQPCQARLQEAVALYRGDFLADFFLADCPAFEEWALLKREWLRREALQALYYLAEGHQRQGDYETAYQYAWRQVEMDLLREEAYQQLMRILALNGRRSEALAQYDACCRVLADELGVEPGKETTELYERIRNDDLGREAKVQMPGGEAFVSPLPQTPRHNLPVQTMPFIGREAELAETARLLSDPEIRLLTILSVGGMGKTRLALKAGQAQLGHYPHGVYFVSLASLETNEAIVPTIAEALSFSFYKKGGAPQQQLLDYLREKTMLLILDNFEHLLSLSAFQSETLAPGEYAAALVTDILQTAPGVKIIVTSRERLKLQEEQLFHIDGIDFPDWETAVEKPTRNLMQDAVEFSAVKLFLHGACQVQPAFALTSDNVMDVVHICRLMEGMPLGILLAAAWVEMLSPAEIGCRISGEISQSLDLLETDLRNVPERQRSIRAVFGHSWRLLTTQERDVFQQLSIFRGGFTQEAARKITGASPPTLKGLVNKSLLHFTSTGRYEIHELTRQFAAEKLSESPDVENSVRNRHSVYYTTFLQQRESDLKGAGQQMAVAEIEMELENAQAAWNWAVVKGNIKWLTRAMESLGIFYGWHTRYQEGEAAFRLATEQLALPMSGKEMRFLVRALAWQASFNNILGRSELVDRLLQQSFSLLDSTELANQDIRAEKAFVLRVKEFSKPFFEGARCWAEESLILYQTLGDRWGTAEVLHSLSTLDWFLGNYDQAKQLCEESLAIRRALVDKRGIAASLFRLGGILKNQREMEEAERLLRESLSQLRELGDRSSNVTGCLYQLGITLEYTGKFAEARVLMKDCFQIHQNLGNRLGAADACEEQGHIEILLGEYQQGRAFIESIQPTLEELNMSFRLGISYTDLGMAALAEKAYAEARRLLKKGAAILREVEARLVPSQTPAYLALTEKGVNNTLQAQQYLAEIIQMAIEVDADLPLFDVLPAATLLMLDYGQEERAVELCALASRNPYIVKRLWCKVRCVLSQALVYLALTERGVKSTLQAQQYLGETIQMAIEVDVELHLFEVLPAAALLMLDNDQEERAVELYALASLNPYIANSLWFADVAGNYISAVAATLPPNIVTNARERGKALDLRDTVTKLLILFEGEPLAND
jgi:DNA-binding SARP family transcriptional activator/predicted ATPase